MKINYRLNREGEFIIENYNFSKPFASFFPGIAGEYGIPLWLFYVNRGQAVISAGTRDKDHAIMEFFPANRAWHMVTSLGFRTFIRISGAGKPHFYEPFRDGFANIDYDLTNQMCISPGELKLKETNRSLGLETQVEYFTIPQDAYAAVARIVTIRNLSRSAKKIQLLDGLPQVVPYGTNNFCLKKMSRTIEAWMDVEYIQGSVPFYKLSVDPADKPEVIHIKGGNFYLSFTCEDHGRRHMIKPITDPGSVFGPSLDFSYPHNFLSVNEFRAPGKEISKNKMPAAFSYLNLELAQDAHLRLYSVVGNARNRELLSSLISKIADPQYLKFKREENSQIITRLQSDIETVSGSRAFDLYAKQTYLDNIMRGGHPRVFKTARSETIFYLYARKHGDLERDYNRFQLEPTYFSQGNGNYRDINQNRRSDVWFNPDIKDENIVTFFNLIQTDGFNPLVLKGMTFTVLDPSGLRKMLLAMVEQKDIEVVLSLMNKPFSPGELLLGLEENRVRLKVHCAQFLNTVSSHSIKHQDAEHGEGFWTDHWTYNLDLLESYLGVYPEKLREILFEKKIFSFYDNSETVRPRQEKYILRDGRIRQFHAVAVDHAKKEMLRNRKEQPHLVRTEYGKGQVYSTTLINKLLCLLVNKLASLDALGIGIEMEADKPNWFDALNGLPGLLGSSTCETFELKRLILFIKEALIKTGVEKIDITQEIYDFLKGLDELVKDFFNSNISGRDHIYWNKSSSLKEEYRAKTRMGLSGSESIAFSSDICPTLDNFLRKVETGIQKAYDEQRGLFYSYFINDAVEYETTATNTVIPTKFNQLRLPFFLESQVHAIRTMNDPKKSVKLHAAVKKSELFDKKLKMYKVTASLKDMPEEIGRCRVFTPGWLENESIWLHMEYKYLLELLKCGLYNEFYEESRNTLIPFQDPRRYGRNILENSSFLVSSAFPDEKLHGNGFVARLSGSTAEFLHIWLYMNTGGKPFLLDKDNTLNLKLSPILPAWLFHKKSGTYSFNFLGNIVVVYHNHKYKDTFGKKGVSVRKIRFAYGNDNEVEIISDTIPAPYALQIRSRQIKRLDIYLE